MAIDKAKAAARESAWRAANPDHVREYHRAWAAANRERLRAKHKEWRDANRDRLRARSQAWSKANPEKRAAAAMRRYYADPDQAKAAGHRRRARIRGVERTLTRTDVAEIRKLQGGRCAICAKKKTLTLDHIVPIARGGAHTRKNAQLLCRSCNASKGARDPIDHMQRLGRLL